MAHDAADALKERFDVDEVAAAQKRAVDVEEVCVLRVPAEALALKDVRLGFYPATLSFALYPEKAGRDLSKAVEGQRAACLTSYTGRSLRLGRLRPRRICDGSISSSAMVRLSGVTVHAQLLCGFALVSSVICQHFDEKTLFELAHGFVVGDSTGMHLGYEGIQFTFHSFLFLMCGLIPLFFLSKVPLPRA